MHMYLCEMIFAIFCLCFIDMDIGCVLSYTVEVNLLSYTLVHVLTLVRVQNGTGR